MDRLSVSQPRGFRTRGHCAPPPTRSPAPAEARPRSALHSRSLNLGLALPAMAAVPERHRVGETATVVQWHRDGFRLYWRWRSKSGRPSVEREVRELIRKMSKANPLWGAPRIHGEL
jgi:hypothetical protein